MDQIKVDNHFLHFWILKRSVGSLLLAIFFSAMAWLMIWGITMDVHSLNFPLFVKCLVIFLVLLVINGVYDYFWQKSFIFSITEGKIRSKGGIANKVDDAIDIKRITEVFVQQDEFDKKFKYASILFVTAVAEEEIIFFGIPIEYANKIKEYVYAQSDKKEKS